MKLGIVGNAADKFTPETERLARLAIEAAIVKYVPTKIISGDCHLGGVDQWAREAALVERDIDFLPFPPERLTWSAYKARNLLIAKTSDLVLCIVSADYPPSYTGQRFETCYHCRNRRPQHVKSGGCWTALHAKRRAWKIIDEKRFIPLEEDEQLPLF